MEKSYIIFVIVALSDFDLKKKFKNKLIIYTFEDNKIENNKKQF